MNQKIEEVIADLTAAADPNGQIPAVQFREIRKEIDGLIGDAFGKESNKYVAALKDSRHQMAADLVDAAKASGNPQYVEAMQSMADKLQKADKLSSFLGKNATTRENRAESALSTAAIISSHASGNTVRPPKCSYTTRAAEAAFGSIT